MKFRPGESWYYGTSSDWAGLVLEKVTSQTLGEHMSENIFTPLGMDDTTFHRQRIAEKFTGRTIQWTYRGPDGRLNPGPPLAPEDPPEHSGGSGLFSTSQDYALFLQALLGASQGQGQLLRKETVDEMFRPQLNEGQSQTLQTLLKGTTPFPEDTPMSHGLSGIINTGDVEGKRRHGSLSWSGMSNGQWVSHSSYLRLLARRMRYLHLTVDRPRVWNCCCALR